jgi:hypothetical protein
MSKLTAADNAWEMHAYERHAYEMHAYGRDTPMRWPMGDAHL